nr:bromodomain adjacent to zinc finger domain protein 1A isoform X1 [Onthophagus taurus]XP_022913841.1 bromodomain adjacent to zinc finger domain protein 1A isoform X1 [Onthophagus taurus]
MPLLKKKPFEKKSPPESLKNTDEVFHCELTNEIFLDYEEFAERTILCNSMVWTCCKTGKSNLTYQEALKSEEDARNSLKHFPNEMRVPVLFLANKTNRTNFSDMSDDVFSYIKERYFVGETVEASFSGAKWGEYHILEVIFPTDDELKKLPKVNGSQNGRFQPPPHVYKYDLEQVDGEDDDVIEKMIADFTQMRRKKGSFTRDKCKLFLKQYVEVTKSGNWIVKNSAVEQFGLDRISFDKIFAGPLPQFENSKKIVKVAPNGKKSKQETLAKFLKDAEGKELKLNAFDEAKKKQEELEQKKQRLAEEKQKKKEEHLKVAKLLQKWHRPKEDLELEDQRKLPEFTPVQSKVPNKYMGDMFMILEFVNSFSKILHTKGFFPDGFTFDVIERALIEKEVAGPLIDLVQMLLNAIFAQQEEETTHVKIALEEIKSTKTIPETPTVFDCTKFATIAGKFSREHQGCRLEKLPMYSLTVTEILRLHLLSSGARINESGARWRYQYRGGYTIEDDPGLYMRMHEPHIIRALEYRNVVELSVKNKIKIVSCLINQLLTYSDIRDIIDERLDNSRQQKVDLKSMHIAEKKRLADVNNAKSRARNGQNMTEEVKQKIKKIEQDSEKHIAEYEKKIGKIKSTQDHVTLLGYDRGFRRYLKLDSISGIFIDTAESNPGKCLTEPIHQVPELIKATDQVILSYLNQISEEVNTSDKENNPKKPQHKTNGGINGVTHQDETKISNDLFVCAGDENVSCPVHTPQRMEEPIKFVPSTDALLELEQTLNIRGNRENELRKSLEYYQLTSKVAATPIYSLTGGVQGRELRVRKQENSNFGHPSDADPIVVMQETLIENILDMEEKLYAGNLGNVKVQDRNHWRTCLSNKNFDDFDRTIMRQNENEKTNGVKEEQERTSSRESSPEHVIIRDSYHDPGWTLSKVSTKLDDDLEDDVDVAMRGKEKQAVECLAIALLQVGLSVDSRYLKKPLGTIETKKSATPVSKPVLENWEKSLLASTSYSQIFLHYGTLDSCISWSKSSLLAWCRMCKKRTDSENMLLCDDCNGGYHLYCLKPKLYSIPQGEWYCWKCQKERQKYEPVDSEPKIKKRKVFRDEDVEDEEAGEEENDVENVKEHENNREDNGKEHDSGSDEERVSNHEGLCTTCGSGGELLSCEKCPKTYHIECVEPPLRHMPRGPWTCHHCKSRKKRNVYRDRNIVMSLRPIQRSGSRANQRRCATRARLKIHGFIKSLCRITSDDSESDDEEVSLTMRLTTRKEAEDLPLHNVALQDLLAEIIKHKDAWAFVRPVQKNEVPDYYDIISNPMDFGTIKYKLNMGNYTCDEEFMNDSVLVFENCNTYNNTDAEVYKCGVRLLKVFRKKSKDLGLKLPEQMQDDDDDEDELQQKSKKRRIK